MTHAQFRTSQAEEEIIATRMRLASETNRSEHFRRVYFSASDGLDGSVGSLRREMQELAKSVEDVRRLLGKLIQGSDADLQLKLLAGVFTLIYPSVPADARQKLDQYMDASKVEEFLAAPGKGVQR